MMPYSIFTKNLIHACERAKLRTLVFLVCLFVLNAQTLVNAQSAGNDKIYYVASDTANALRIADIDRTAALLSNSANLLKGNKAYRGYDIDADFISQKLYWIDGNNYKDVHFSNLDGTGFNTISNVDAFTLNGLAIGGNQLFFNGYSGIQRSDLNGANKTLIVDADDFYDVGDIEYYKGKLYFVFVSANETSSQIVEANIDGGAQVVLYKTLQNIKGLTIASDTVYWTENYPASAASSIYKKAISSGSTGTPAVIHNQGNKFYGDLMVDPFSKTLYVHDSDPKDKNHSVLTAMSTKGTNIRQVTNWGIYVNAFVFNNTDPIVTDISEVVTEDLKLYPNPSTGIFTIETSKEGALEIVNSLGVKITSLDLKQGENTFDTNLAAGMYFLKLNNLVFKIFVE